MVQELPVVLQQLAQSLVLLPQLPLLCRHRLELPQQQLSEELTPA